MKIINIILIGYILVFATMLTTRTEKLDNFNLISKLKCLTILILME